MKIGFVSAVFPEMAFQEVIDFASEEGFQCVEIMCWPKGKAERKYAGVTHIDADKLNSHQKEAIKKYLKDKGVEISGLGYYPNPLIEDDNAAKIYIDHLYKVIDAAAELDIFQVNTFIGRDKNKNIEPNYKKFKRIWRPIIEFAEKKGVKIGIENCPMIFTDDEWPGGNNLAFSPKIWRRMFTDFPSDYFGLNYDPSHLVWQQINYIKPIYEFRKKIYHIHLQDVKVYKEKLDEVGIRANPLEFKTSKIPGLGDINWSQFIMALRDIGYKESMCIEMEDRSFEENIEMKKNALRQSFRYIRQYVPV